MLSVSKSFPTHLVVSSVARNLLFDNRSPLGLRLGVTKREARGDKKEKLGVTKRKARDNKRVEQKYES